MVTTDQIKRGIGNYLDAEIMPKLPGYKKWLFGAGATEYLQKTDRIMQELKKMKAVELLDVIQEDGMVDIESLYRALKPVAETCDAEIELPVIGKITLCAADVERIYREILKA